MIDLTFPRLRGLRSVRYHLPDHVVTLLRQYRQRSGQNEMGGVLAGRLQRGPGGQRWIVSHLSLPSSAHAAGPTWFRLHPPTAQRFVDQIFEKSGGRVYFCGFWHTHPERVPHRSPQDKNVITDLFVNGRLEIATQLGVIVGTGGGISTWCQRKDGTTRNCLGCQLH